MFHQPRDLQNLPLSCHMAAAIPLPRSLPTSCHLPVFSPFLPQLLCSGCSSNHYPPLRSQSMQSLHMSECPPQYSFLITGLCKLRDPPSLLCVCMQVMLKIRYSPLMLIHLHHILLLYISLYSSYCHWMLYLLCLLHLCLTPH